MSRATSTVPVGLAWSATLAPSPLGKPPAVGQPGHPGVFDAGPHREGVETAVVVVGVAVPRVDRHVEQVLPLDQVEPLDLQRDLALAGELPEVVAVDAGVGPVAADPVLPEHADPEDRVLDWPRRPPRDLDGARLAGVVEVALGAGGVAQPDPRDLDLAAAPARGGAGGDLGLGFPVLHAQRPGLVAGHLAQVAADDLARLAVRHEPALVEPHRLVAEPLDAAEVVGDEDDRLAARLE